MTKRQRIYNKYGGLCAYTGKTLPVDWQIDHLYPIVTWIDKADDITNLVPCLPIINHYKRARTLEEFRDFMLKFPERYAKLPKTTRVPATQKRKEYMERVKIAFEGTTIWSDGKFWFEAQK